MSYAPQQETSERLVAERRASLATLSGALGAFSAKPSWEGLQDVVDAVPLVVSVDVVELRVLEEGSGRRLYLVAAAGLSGREVGRFAYDLFTLAQARTLLASAPANAVSRELGLRWARGLWLEGEGVVGTLLTGSRTRRIPAPEEWALLCELAEAIAGSLDAFDRSPVVLRRRSAALARGMGVDGGRRAASAGLRSREAQILELYDDGLTTAEIAELLVISRHTVRTHVRNVLRRLGVSSRGEAVSEMRRRQVLSLLDPEAAGRGAG